MNKAFIFDMDGVLLNNEPVWNDVKARVYTDLFGPEIKEKMENTTGLSLDKIFNLAKSFGANTSRKDFDAVWDKEATYVYTVAPLTPELDKLIAYLQENEFKLGLVSASPISWIKNSVFPRLSFADKFEIVISLHERTDLHHKPAPDGYLEAMKVLETEPKDTIILEDSNAGIAAGIAAGAFVIGLQENLVPGYKQTGADVYAKSIKEVLEIVEKRN